MAKYNKLAGKHVLVIGGSKGIGRGVVEASIEAGARVTLSGSSPQTASAAVSAIQAAYPSYTQLTGLSCDLSQATVEANLDALLARAKEIAPLDHVVLTAADALTLSELPALTQAQITAATHMRLVVPTLLGKVVGRHVPRTPQHSYTITTGGIADRPSAGWAVMAFLAAGLTGLARNLAVDLEPLRVNAVEPGFVDTPLWEATMPNWSAADKAEEFRKVAARMPTGAVGRVEDVAEAYVYLMKDANATGEIVKTRSGANLV
ncbi:short-chain dehydrogenase [Xylariaceae sp. FL0662B]|nr:short-chain dehydrogenase [Xylariaceae sp. FL0662B]